MKIKRAKKVSKTLEFFRNNFGFRAPYQVLLDGTFSAGCLEAKVNIKEQIPKYLGEARLFTTPCCITELEQLNCYGAMMVAKGFPVFKCGHQQAEPASTCIASLVGGHNSRHFVVATNDYGLRTLLRGVPGTPVLYLHGNSPTLERPSELTRGRVEQEAEERTGVTTHQARTIKAMKKQVFGEEVKPKKKKRKGPKGPNPLSCKKKKKDSLKGVKGGKIKKQSSS